MQSYMMIIHTMKPVMIVKGTGIASPSQIIHAGEAGRSEACKIFFTHPIYTAHVNIHPGEAPAGFA